ncbi:methylmalonyl-CoA mutase family protein [Paenisporosarcina cavernae]|uniref:Methylmalonyl-CoA mutase alpha/beta chain catalytic domain-containing protein n=1 Tax=Paenisporosarcina cavernae TaxID=2320858 RepID=A0A385YVD2_9BACL|nr:methylmalonyl-CoA mutase family protein [Paenisporosarcina cavernae]AYC29522.1 hypothetical protein D3873_06350 [Paenisporosarcina cavernae]
MNVQQMKDIQFQDIQEQQWMDAAFAALKGKSMDSLITPTPEGIDLQPLYSTNKVAEVEESREGWKIAQTSLATTISTFLQETKEALANGVEVFGYASTLANEQWTDADMMQLKQYILNYPIMWDIQSTNDPILQIIQSLTEEEKSSVHGTISGIESPFPNVEHAITTEKIHLKGASAVEELTYVLLQLANQQEARFQAVRLHVDTHFFMEIAKLRAMRILWKAFHSTDQHDIPALTIESTTSVRSFSKLDEHVNLLRAGNETLAMVLGGSDVIHTTAYNVLTTTDAKSRRLAKNMGLILREEAGLSGITDAANGSYAIEALTEELVKKSWELFLQLVDLPFTAAQEELFHRATALHEKREQALFTRKSSMVGVNQYANPSDEIKSLSTEKTNRVAIPFESLRYYFSKNPLKAAVVQIGELKAIKVRTDFVVGFLQAGGVVPNISQVFETAEMAQKFIEEGSYDYVVLSATDDDLTNFVPVFSSLFKQTIVEIAGKHPQLEKWKQDGLHGAIYIGQSIPAKMKEIQALTEGGNTSNGK